MPKPASSVNDSKLRRELPELPVLVKLAIAEQMRNEHLLIKYGSLDDIEKLLLKEAAVRGKKSKRDGRKKSRRRIRFI